MLSLSIVLEGGQTTNGSQESQGDSSEFAYEARDSGVGDASTRRHRLREALLLWYEESARDLPWRRTSDPYAILVSEVMLQQTQVDRVIPKYEEFLARFPTLTALAEASRADVIRVWAPLGYNRRAVHLQRLACEVVEHYGGVLPDDVKALRSLPGIGSYTAAAIACFAFGRPVAVVDTNVRRILGRLEGAVQTSEAAAGRMADAYLVPERAADWNQALMDLGATLCRASSPACLLCPLQTVCRSAGSVIREQRAKYQTSPQERFEASNRYQRGRIVDYLRGAGVEQGSTIEDLAEAVGLSDSAGRERLAALLRSLEHDGLVTVDVDHDRISLPR